VAERTCSIPDCNDPHLARGYCNRHYHAWKRYGDPLATKYVSVEERFWAKVDRRGPDDCWPWRAALHHHGYGAFGVDSRHRAGYAHRVAYELLVGPIPDGLTLDYQCHNADPSCSGGHACQHRRCCNPAHLEPATNRDNILRGESPSAGNARKTRCSAGHPFDTANTYVRPNGVRGCRACHREEVKRAQARRRGGSS